MDGFIETVVCRKELKAWDWLFQQRRLEVTTSSDRVGRGSGTPGVKLTHSESLQGSRGTCFISKQQKKMSRRWGKKAWPHLPCSPWCPGVLNFLLSQLMCLLKGTRPTVTCKDPRCSSVRLSKCGDRVTHTHQDLEHSSIPVSSLHSPDDCFPDVVTVRLYLGV